MTKFNSTTAILSDLDGVILDLNYDMKFWQDWLPDALTLSSGKTRSDIKAELVAMMKNQEASLNWYDLNYWDEYFKVDCLEIIKAQEINNYYRIPADNRDLNYNKYFIKGEEKITYQDDYTSHNTKRLNIEEIKELLLSIDYVKDRLNA